MSLCTMKNANSPMTHLAAALLGAAMDGYNVTISRAVGAVADASNGEVRRRAEEDRVRVVLRRRELRKPSYLFRIT